MTQLITKFSVSLDMRQCCWVNHYFRRNPLLPSSGSEDGQHAISSQKTTFLVATAGSSNLSETVYTRIYVKNVLHTQYQIYFLCHNDAVWLRENNLCIIYLYL